MLVRKSGDFAAAPAAADSEVGGAQFQIPSKDDRKRDDGRFRSPRRPISSVVEVGTDLWPAPRPVHVGRGPVLTMPIMRLSRPVRRL